MEKFLKVNVDSIQFLEAAVKNQLDKIQSKMADLKAKVANKQLTENDLQSFEDNVISNYIGAALLLEIENVSEELLMDEIGPALDSINNQGNMEPMGAMDGGVFIEVPDKDPDPMN